MLHLEITTPDKTIFKGSVDLVQLPGIDGSFELLEHHAPLISVLKQGKIKIKNNKEEKFFEIKGGVVEVLEDKVIILAE